MFKDEELRRLEETSRARIENLQSEIQKLQRQTDSSLHKERELLDRADRFRLKSEDLEMQLHKSIGEERKDNVEMKLKLE